MKMKRIYLPLILMLFIFACTEDPADDVTKDDDQEQNDDNNNDDDDNDDDSDDDECLIFTIYSEEGDGDKITTTFEYDDEGNMVKMTELEEWIEDGETMTDTDELIGTYEDGKLVSIGSNDDGAVEILYDGDKILKYVSSDTEDGAEEIDEYRFVYDGDVVVKVENWDNYSGETAGEFVLYSYEEFTYTGSNLTKINQVEVLDEDGEKELLEIGYDDKVNPFKGNLFWLFWEGDFEVYFSDNNPTSLDEEYTYNGETETYSETVTYSYNDDGLPTEATYSDADGDSWSYDLSYTCDED